jgi:SAM-dependent methyltransferase
MKLETLQSCNLCDAKGIVTLDAENHICQCRVCGYVFDNPRPAAAEVAAFYSRPGQYSMWITEEKARDLLWKRRLRKMERTRKPGTLLDVGTGIGQFLHYARAAYSKVYGTEVSDGAIRIAKERYGLDVMKGDLEGIDFGGLKFDTITLFHVLEHVPNPKSVVERCRQLLSEGGVVVIAVPNDILSMRPKIRKVLALGKGNRSGESSKLGLTRISLDGSMQEIHVSHFTPSVLERFLQACGFTLLENTLDPFYAATGLRKLKEDLYYAVCAALRFLFRFNIYDAIWVVARKKQATDYCKCDSTNEHGS